jgi:hypothetical protein
MMINIIMTKQIKIHHNPRIINANDKNGMGGRNYRLVPHENFLR